MKKHIGTGLVLLLSIIILAGCDSNDKHFIIGKWKNNKGYTVTFKRDNTVIHTYKNYKKKYDYKIINPKNDNKIFIKETNSEAQFKWNFKITSPSTLEVEKIKGYDKNGGLVMESNSKGDKMIYQKVE